MALAPAVRVLRRDPTGMALQGGSRISGILNVAVSGTKFVTVKIPAGWGCKAIACQLRSGGSWYARQVGAKTYFTVSRSLSLNLALHGGENLFQVMTAGGADVLEIMMID